MNGWTQSRSRLADLTNSFLQGQTSATDYVCAVTDLWREHRDAKLDHESSVSDESRALVERRLRGEVDSAEFERRYSELWSLGNSTSDSELFDELHSICHQYHDPAIGGNALSDAELLNEVKRLSMKLGLL
jgi:hypothetical protein